MNPPINRENLRDVLIAIALANGLAWAVTAFKECAANSSPPPAAMAVQFVPSQETP
jgi:hypothetical protein